MERVKKTGYVSSLKEKFSNNSVVIILNQSGLTVSEIESFRKEVRAVESEYMVVKNTLARLAVSDTKNSPAVDMFKNQVAVVFGNSIVEVCKVAVTFMNKVEGKVSVIGGVSDGNLLSEDYIKAISKLPSMDELRAKIIAIIQTPASRMARVLKSYSEKE